MFPIKKITIETPLSADEIKERLGLLITQEEYIANPFNVDTPYYGSIEDDDFMMKPVRTLIKNDFAPIANGTIVTENNTTKINLVIRMKITVILSLFILFVVTIFTMIKAPSDIRIGASILFIAFYTFALVIFNYGIKIMKLRLNLALNNQE